MDVCFCSGVGDGFYEGEEGHVLWIVAEVEICGDGSEFGQLGLDAGVDVGFVVHVWCFDILAWESADCRGGRGPDVVF